MNKLILGDNLEILKTLDSESIDLIYLDPPFFSNRNYEIIWGDAGEIRSFQDRWAGGIEHYIAWLKERVEQMHRLLKNTGSIFLHCDWHANAEIKVFVLNKIFGEQNFRNEIIWKRNSAHNSANRCGAIHDTLFYYAKSSNHSYNQIFQAYEKEYLETFFDSVDEQGKRYKRSDLTGAGVTKSGETNQIWRGINVTAKGRHWMYPPSVLNDLDAQGKIHWTKKSGGMPRLKVYPEDMKGVPLQDVWNDIRVLHNNSKERIGYPTQKPEALIERIIKMASNENDVILDPFVGGGTTLVVADRFKRQWIGIDQSVQAIKVSELRLQKQQDLFSTPFIVQLHKYDYDTLRYQDAFQFEHFIIQQLGGTSNAKQRNDLGLDGKTGDNVPIQVKRSENIGRNVIDNFQSACKRFDSALFETRRNILNKIGILVAFSFSKGAVEEVARLRNQENVIIELLKVEDLVPIAKKPKLTVSFTSLSKNDKGVHAIQLIAKAESDNDIEFYAWDFDYNANDGFKADILIDKTGIQKQHFSAGSHAIAVKAVDTDGLESIEIIILKINGIVGCSP